MMQLGELESDQDRDDGNEHTVTRTGEINTGQGALCLRREIGEMFNQAFWYSF